MTGVDQLGALRIDDAGDRRAAEVHPAVQSVQFAQLRVSLDPDPDADQAAALLRPGTAIRLARRARPLDPRDPASALTLQRARQECVLAKETLSRDTSTSVAVQLPGRHTDVPLSRDEFEAMIRTPLEATLEALHRTLNSAGIAPDDLAGVLLVGGSSRIPLVSRMLSQNLGRPVLVDPQPQHCVALGAAAIAECMSRQAARAPRRTISGRRGRHLLAATAAGVLLIGGAVYVGRPGHSPPPTAEPKPTSTPQPGLIGSPIAQSRSPSPSVSPSVRASSTPSPTLTPSRTPAFVPTTGVVLAIGGKCLDVANGLAVAGRQIEIFTCNGTAAQTWTLSADHTFRAFGKCMDADTIRAATDPDSTQVQLQDCTAGPTQRFQVSAGTIVNPATTLCLSVLNNNPDDRTALFLGTCKGEGGQLWTIPNLPAADSAAPSADKNP